MLHLELWSVRAASYSTYLRGTWIWTIRDMKAYEQKSIDYVTEGESYLSYLIKLPSMYTPLLLRVPFHPAPCVLDLLPSSSVKP
jgi:hypothetical protein